MAVGLAKGGLVPVLGSSSTSGVQQSQLARHASPPTKLPVASMILHPLWIGPLLGLILGIVAALAFKMTDLTPAVTGTYVLLQSLGVYRAVKNNRWNRDTWPTAYGAWQRKWFCHRCGTTFEPAPAADAART